MVIANPHTLHIASLHTNPPMVATGLVHNMVATGLVHHMVATDHRLMVEIHSQQPHTAHRHPTRPPTNIPEVSLTASNPTDQLLATSSRLTMVDMAVAVVTTD